MDQDTEALTEQLKLVEALHHIASESNEADIVRYAMGALAGTTAGVVFLEQRPVLV